jgi:hypothetical protein
MANENEEEWEKRLRIGRRGGDSVTNGKFRNKYIHPSLTYDTHIRTLIISYYDLIRTHAHPSIQT